MSPLWSAESRSTSSETSAKSRAGRSAVPAKITSSMPAPRIDLGELSPITQRIASSTFDLPQPFGPDDAGEAVLDAQLRRLDEALEAGKFQPPDAHFTISSPLWPSSTAQQRLDPCPTWCHLDHPAVDHKGRACRLPRRVGGPPDRFNPVETGLLGKAGALRGRRQPVPCGDCIEAEQHDNSLHGLKWRKGAQFGALRIGQRLHPPHPAAAAWRAARGSCAK